MFEIEQNKIDSKLYRIKFFQTENYFTKPTQLI